jgi:hypothetical protein
LRRWDTGTIWKRWILPKLIGPPSHLEILLEPPSPYSIQTTKEPEMLLSIGQVRKNAQLRPTTKGRFHPKLLKSASSAALRVCIFGWLETGLKKSSNAALCHSRFLHGKMAFGCGLDCLDHQVAMSLGISG